MTDPDDFRVSARVKRLVNAAVRYRDAHRALMSHAISTDGPHSMDDVEIYRACERELKEAARQI